MDASGESDLGMAPNVGGMLCYAPCCIGAIVSIVAMVVEKQSRFVRFHAFQSLLLHVAAIAVGILLGIASMVMSALLGLLGLLMNVLGMLVFLALAGLMILLMVKVHKGEAVELPVIGELAKQWM